MKSASPYRRSLTSAIGAILLLGLAPHAFASTTEVTDPPLIVFGKHEGHIHDLLDASGPASRRSTGLVAGDFPVADPRALALVAANELENLGDARARLWELFHAGVPVFVCMEGAERQAVARFFGIAPPAGDVIFVREPDGDIDVLSVASGNTHWDAHWTHALAKELVDFQHRAEEEGAKGRLAATPESASVPMLRIHEGVIDTGSDEITGRLSIDVIRSATRTGDEKEIHVHTWPSVTPTRAGIHEGHKQGENLTAAYLPWVYRVSHRVTATNATASMVDYLPLSDGRTEFDYAETKERTLGIGGTSGDSLSVDGKPDALLAAKIPFNLAFNYAYTSREELRFRFNDYSLVARPTDKGTRILWEAPIAPALKHSLVERVYADKVELTEKRMTPMMRSATMATWSGWKLPGGYEGMANVRIDLGYDRNEKTWWWERSDWKHDDRTIAVSKSVSYDLDLSHPFLSSEITVLLRSNEGLGGCIAQDGQVVRLASCDPTNRAQMWGFDSEGRYVNRADGRCLQADLDRRVLVTARCSLSNNQVWEWRADRIHSGYGDRYHRLYVENGNLRFFAPAGRFDATPVNPHASALKPWSGYPNAPLAGELVPAPFGTQAGTVPAEWMGRYGPVGAEQRWTPIVLRAGL
ncbi:ricin-type beta-trefoil lectin domain protein [Luteibacter aegosomatis]|uniref:RICIN domain-containing protein n=1 Tax=Luteibacter aegosomatis TaxID=2911537 RepID=UPI001FF871C4|nr:RICIN domain-containing protein [Luteibacter aegosomatis]UPG84315.1 ricin-type beta-trefoil lectin domain protein [Luteibacter aegosomatis]